MEVLIENYRGFDITFQTESERFSYKIDTGSWHEKQSYAACKKSIDEYLKSNSAFKPFFVRNLTSGKKIKIIGIRKDERFVYEGTKGEKEQMGDYDERNYILFEESDESIYATIATLEIEIGGIGRKITEYRKTISGVPLKDAKKKLLAQ